MLLLLGLFCHLGEYKFHTFNLVVRELLALDIEVGILWFMLLNWCNLRFFDVSVTLCSLVFSELLSKAQLGIVESPREVCVHSIMKFEGSSWGQQKETKEGLW